MRRVLYNCKAYVDAGNFVDAVLVDGNRIYAVGEVKEILKMPHEESINCRGKTLIPGFNDAHLHIVMISEARMQLQLLGVRGIDEIIGLARDFIEKNPNLKVLYGMGWNTGDFSQGEIRNLNRWDLDRISQEIPVILKRACGHMLACNTRALEMAEIDGNSAQLDGGFFESDQSGPNGRFYENAMELIDVLKPSLEGDQLKEAMEATLMELVKQGITTVHSNDCGISLKPKVFFEVFDGIYKNKNPYPRVYHQMCFTDPKEMEIHLADELTCPPESSKRSWGPLKLFKDGSLGGHSALVKRPYLDDEDNFGMDILPREEARAFTGLADKYGLQVITHTIGDRAMEEMMDIYEGHEKTERWGLVHCQITDEKILDRISHNRLVAIIQPIFLRSDISSLRGAISEEIQESSYAWKTMIEKDIKIALSTDSPIESFNPFENIYAAVERKDLKGEPREGFFIKERLTVEEAIDAYTSGSAYVEFKEKEKGRIKAGHLADLVLLDRDIFTVESKELLKTKVIMTMVDGEIVYEKLEN